VVREAKKIAFVEGSVFSEKGREDKKSCDNTEGDKQRKPIKACIEGEKRMHRPTGKWSGLRNRSGVPVVGATYRKARGGRGRFVTGGQAGAAAVGQMGEARPKKRQVTDREAGTSASDMAKPSIITLKHNTTSQSDFDWFRSTDVVPAQSH